MQFNDHRNLNGKHAFLSASKYSWIRYNKSKLVDTYKNFKAAERGTILHEFASTCINLGQKLPRNKKTLNRFVNDAIGYKMTSEQPLYYSDNCFGTADAISFNNNILRIHDLKSGVTKPSMDQLLIYAAMFCLEYKIKPSDISIELRIYYMNDVIIFEPEVDDIVPIMDTIVEFDKIINELKSEGE